MKGKKHGRFRWAFLIFLRFKKVISEEKVVFLTIHLHRLFLSSGEG